MSAEPQCMQALAKANEKRAARAALRRRVNSGEVPIAAVIESFPDVLRSSPHNHAGKGLTISDILQWQHRWGRVRAERFLRRLQISPSMQLAHLSEARRAQLARRLL